MRRRAESIATRGVLLGSCLLGAAAYEAMAGTAVIRGAAIVDVERAELIRGKDIVITDGVIARLVPAGEAVAGAGVADVDARGLYAMPGLFDAHVHLTASPETYPTMLVVHGVTAARDLGGPTDVVVALRDDCREGRTLGPDLFVTGAIIDGDPPVWPFSEACDTPEQGRAAVRKLKAAGVDQIKVYSRLKKDVYEAVLAEAKAAGLKVTGHIPESVTLREALAAGQSCNEHLMRFDAAIAGLAGKEEERNRPVNRTLAGWASFEEVSEEALRGLAREVAASGMVQCPTIVVMQGIGRTIEKDAAADPMLAYVPGHIREFWMSPQYTSWAQYAAQVVPPMQKLVKILHDEGVPLMVGTDLANPFIFAGASVHMEMALWQDAGIKPADVLRAATMTPARFCGVEEKLGSIAPGKTASLLLVKGNPLEDVRHAAQIESVYLRGEAHSRAKLDELMSNLRRTVEQGDAPAAKEGDADAVAAAALPGKEVARGAFRYTFGKFPAGDETYVITRADEGYYLFTESKPKGGGSPPSTLRAELSAGGAVRKVDWHQMGPTPVVATYVVEDGAIRANAVRGGEKLPEQVTKLEANHVFMPSATAWTYFEFRGYGLKPGESRELVSLGFGFPDWRVQPTPYKVTRLEDTTVAFRGADVPCGRYLGELTTPMGPFRSEAWVDADNVPYRVELNMPFGKLLIERE